MTNPVPSFPRRRESSSRKDSRLKGNDIGAPKKSLGQHWLFDESSLSAMLNAGELTASDTVLEVGPGLGTLTQKLCQNAKQVIAVELDQNLATKLRSNLNEMSSSDQHSKLSNTLDHSTLEELRPDFSKSDDTFENLEIVNQSILDFDTSVLPKDYKVIANIPYYLTSNLIRKMLENPNPPRIIVLLIQKEVAERIAAKPGEMGILSVATQFYAEVALREPVSAELFTPPPKVDSQIIQIRRRTHPLFADVNTKKFFTLVRAGFSEKRKKLRSSLSGGLNITKLEADNLLQKSGISLNARAQELSLEDWYRLYKTFNVSS